MKDDLFTFILHITSCLFVLRSNLWLSHWWSWTLLILSYCETFNYNLLITFVLGKDTTCSILYNLSTYGSRQLTEMTTIQMTLCPCNLHVPIIIVHNDKQMCQKNGLDRIKNRFKVKSLKLSCWAHWVLLH